MRSARRRARRGEGAAVGLRAAARRRHAVDLEAVEGRFVLAAALLEGRRARAVQAEVSLTVWARATSRRVEARARAAAAAAASSSSEPAARQTTAGASTASTSAPATRAAAAARGAAASASTGARDDDGLPALEPVEHLASAADRHERTEQERGRSHVRRCEQATFHPPARGDQRLSEPSASENRDLSGRSAPTRRGWAPSPSRLWSARAARR